MHMNSWRVERKKLYLFFLVGFIEFFIFFNRGLMKTVDKKKKNPEKCKQSHYIHNILPGRRTPSTPESKSPVEEPPAEEQGVPALK